MMSRISRDNNGSNNGFTLFYKYVRKAYVYNNFTIGSQSAYSQSFRKAHI